MKKKICILVTLILTLCLYLGRNNFIYATETKVDLNDSGSLYALIEDGVCTIKGHGEFNGNSSDALKGENFSEIIFRGDRNIITFDKMGSDYFSYSTLANYITRFVIDEESNVDTKRVQMFMSWFDGQTKLKDLDISGINTTSATDINGMFNNCSSLESINLSCFDTRNANTVSSNFNGCSSLEELIIPNLYVKEGTNFSGFLPSIDSSLKIIDLRYADLTNLNEEYFFGSLPDLEKIYVPEKTADNISLTDLTFGNERTFYICDRNGYIGTKENPQTTTTLISSNTVLDGTTKKAYYLTINKPDSIKELVNISATKKQTTYATNESIKYNDITVTARYDNGTKKTVTNYTYSLENDNSIMISYTEGGITRGTSIHLTITDPKVVLSSITVTKDKKDYDDTSSITWEDLKVTANYSDGTKKSIPYNDTNLKIDKVEDDIYNIKYTDPDDTSVTKTVEMILNIKGVDTLRYIDARKTEDEYDTYKDVDLDDITCYAYYTKSGKVKLDEIDEEEYKKTTDDRKDGFCVFYDPDDEEDYITVKYKHNGIEYKDTISLDIDEDDDDEDDNRYLKSIVAYKDKKEYYSDEKVDYDDIYIKVNYYSSSKKSKTVYYTDDDKNMKVSINSAKTKITVKYTYNGETCTDTITIKQLDGNNPSNTVVVQGNKQIVLYIGNRTCYINGITKTLDAAPEIKNDRTYLPIRHVVEALGGQVYWSSTNPNTVKIYKDNVDIILTIGARYASVNGVTHILDDAPYTKNDRTYMPVRFISEQLGAIVDWSASNPYQVVVRNR